jgi:hypothetical protein
MCEFSENVARDAGFARPVVVTPDAGARWIGCGSIWRMLTPIDGPRSGRSMLQLRRSVW